MDRKKWTHLVKYVVDTNGHWAHGARERERMHHLHILNFISFHLKFVKFELHNYDHDRSKANIAQDDAAQTNRGARSVTNDNDTVPAASRHRSYRKKSPTHHQRRRLSAQPFPVYNSSTSCSEKNGPPTSAPRNVANVQCLVNIRRTFWASSGHGNIATSCCRDWHWEHVNFDTSVLMFALHCYSAIRLFL